MSLFTSRHNARMLLGALVLCVVQTGCGSGSNETTLARLQGRVTVDDQPIEQGSLQFLPLGEGSATGSTITNGAYDAEVPLGKVRVVISATKPTGRMIEEYSSRIPEVVNIVPPQYASGIEIDVAGDNAAQHFTLKSR